MSSASNPIVGVSISAAPFVDHDPDIYAKYLASEGPQIDVHCPLSANPKPLSELSPDEWSRLRNLCPKVTDSFVHMVMQGLLPTAAQSANQSQCLFLNKEFQALIKESPTRSTITKECTTKETRLRAILVLTLGYAATPASEFLAAIQRSPRPAEPPRPRDTAFQLPERGLRSPPRERSAPDAPGNQVALTSPLAHSSHAPRSRAAARQSWRLPSRERPSGQFPDPTATSPPGPAPAGARPSASPQAATPRTAPGDLA
eukprot:gene2021-477_t